MDLLTTISGSLMEGFLPRGWDLAKIDACCSHPAESIRERRPWWHPHFEPVACESVADFDVMLGHEIAQAIRRARDQGREAAMILPVGPMGMYRWAVYFLKEWGVSCGHVHGFNGQSRLRLLEGGSAQGRRRARDWVNQFFLDAHLLFFFFRAQENTQRLGDGARALGAIGGQRVDQPIDEVGQHSR